MADNLDYHRGFTEIKVMFGHTGYIFVSDSAPLRRYFALYDNIDPIQHIEYREAEAMGYLDSESEQFLHIATHLDHFDRGILNLAVSRELEAERIRVEGLPEGTAITPHEGVVLTITNLGVEL